MKRIKFRGILISFILAILVLLCACNSSAEKLQSDLIGEWGRLGEPMHSFSEDGSCIIGGMQGTFRIDDDKNLVVTTMSGSETIFEFAESLSKADSENYWYLSGNNLTVNGNTFERIIEEGTPDSGK